MKFEYQFAEGRFLPIVTIKLQGKQGGINSTAYLDTGASYSLFHTDIAEILGIQLEKGELSEMTVGDGDTLKVYLHKLKVQIADKEFFAMIGFSKGIGIGIGFNIGGIKDIFDRFIICFHQKEKYVEFTLLQ